MGERTYIGSTLRLQTQSESDENIIEGFQFQLDDLAKSALSSEQIHLLLCKEGPEDTLTLRINGVHIVGHRLVDEASPTKDVVEMVGGVMPIASGMTPTETVDGCNSVENDKTIAKTESVEVILNLEDEHENVSATAGQVEKVPPIQNSVKLVDTSLSFQEPLNLLKRPRQESQELDDSGNNVEHSSIPGGAAVKRQKTLSEESSAVELEAQRKLLFEF